MKKKRSTAKLLDVHVRLRGDICSRLKASAIKNKRRSISSEIEAWLEEHAAYLDRVASLVKPPEIKDLQQS